MMKFDHLSIPVTDTNRSRDWYVATLGLKVEFEVPDRRAIALQYSEGFALFLQESSSPVSPNGCAMRFQVPDVDATFAEWFALGVTFAHGPRKSFLGIRDRACRPGRIPCAPVGQALDEGEIKPQTDHRRCRRAAERALPSCPTI
jgi:catechol 2,3-dioxygenase-like lactoylglutathione lyase family enzyme